MTEVDTAWYRGAEESAEIGVSWRSAQVERELAQNSAVARFGEWVVVVVVVVVVALELARRIVP
jgi:hypothetical protein